MKKYLSFLLLLNCWNFLNAQCSTGGVSLFSQEDVDTYVSNYGTCTTIDGDLIISDGASGMDITDLSGLQNLTSVEGAIYIVDNPQLTDLTGFQNLSTTAGELVINSNDQLTDLNGLQNLTSVGAFLTFFQNPNLISLDGLENLNTITEDLVISGNTQLSNIDALSGIGSIPGFLRVQNNPQLTDLDGLSNVTFLGEFLEIVGNTSLTDLDGLQSLISIGGTFQVNFNPLLANIDGLQYLTSISGTLNLNGNTALVQFCGLFTLYSNPSNGVSNSFITGNASNPTPSEIVSGGACTRILPTQWTQLGQPIEGENALDFSGQSVSLSADGNRLAIGARLNDDNGENAGHTRVFEWDGNQWVQLGQDIDGEDPGDFSSHSISLSANGERIAIGAPLNDGNGDDSGHTRIFEWDGNQWTQLGQDIDGEGPEDQSGFSVSLSANGERVAIGAPLNDGNGFASGHARIYEWDGNQWIQLGQNISGEAAIDQSGYSVSLSASGERVAIGAVGNSDNGDFSGHVRIFEWNGNQWVQLGQDIDGEGEGDLSGRPVSLSAAGNRVAIGASENDDNGENAGHTRVFEWDGNQWVQLGQDIDGEAADDRSGSSVSLSASGSRVVIGAPGNDDNGENAGHTRVFEWDGNQWVQLGGNIAGESAGDVSGRFVSLSANGSRVAIASTDNSGSLRLSGHTRVFEGFLPRLESLPMMPPKQLLLLGTLVLGIGIFSYRKLF